MSSEDPRECIICQILIRENEREVCSGLFFVGQMATSHDYDKIRKAIAPFLCCVNGS